ncbi:MAG: hypothetical protein JO224_02275 [Pelomonas sp.]|nr:hypothetical protein [Roseateles sp.]
MDMQISSSTNTQSTDGTTWQQTREDFKDLADALKSGNLDAAKQAYADLSKNVPAAALNNPNSPLAKIGQALDSGDISGAQSAMKSMHAHRGHGGHRPESSGSEDGNPVSAIEATTTASPSPATSTTGNLLNEVA